MCSESPGRFLLRLKDFNLTFADYTKNGLSQFRQHQKAKRFFCKPRFSNPNEAPDSCLNQK
jgi:hypothetical protein